MITPILNNVLVKPMASDNISAGGIIVSDAHKELSNKVEVIAVGKGTQKNPMNFKPGDIVFRVKGDGDLIEYNGAQYFIVKSQYLLAKLN